MRSPSSSLLFWLQLILFGGLILYFGQTVWVTLSFAFLISFVLYPFCRWLERRRVPRSLSIGFALLAFVLVVAGVAVLLIRQLMQFRQLWPALSAKVTGQLHRLTDYLDALLQAGQDDRQQWLSSALSSALQHTVGQLPGVLYSTSVSAVLVLLIPIFAALILFYRDLLVTSVLHLAPPHWRNAFATALPEVINTYYNFIKGMALVYLAVGILNSLGLLLLGVPQAIFFGFMASVLTFIPYVGITVGALLPMAVAWLTYDSLYYPLGVVVVFVIVQLLEANVIFPVAVGYKLRINTLVLLLVILAGGLLWGTAGMILFIPFVGILKLFSERVPAWKPLALLLGTHEDPPSSTRKAA
ncbi:AI-2E family transporter [Catalinimonas alkaloidigena]|nr:AI-2E family transporter [Catalinimonas alkaloidigena]